MRLQRGRPGGTALEYGQRLQDVAAATQCSQQQRDAGHQADQAGAFPEAAPAAGAWAQRIHGLEIDTGVHQQGGPHEHLHEFREQRRDQPDRHRQQGYAKEFLHRFHPGASTRQQGAGGETDQQQGHAHPQGQGEQ